MVNEKLIEMNLKTQRNLLLSILLILLLLLLFRFILGNIESNVKHFSGPVPKATAQEYVDDANRDSFFRGRYGRQTKSVFMDNSSFARLTLESNLEKDQIYKDLKESSQVKRKGIHIYFGEKEGEETVFLVSGFTTGEDEAEKFYIINPYELYPENLGDLCPNKCPDTKYFYSN